MSGQGDRGQGQVDQEEQTGKVSKGAESGCTNKGTGRQGDRDWGCTEEGTEIRDGPTRRRPFIIHSFFQQIFIKHYTPGSVLELKTQQGNKVWRLPASSVSQSKEKRPRANK